MSTSSYHHGDLRRAVLDGALEAIAADGAAALSLREVARRAGVSHAAPAHHFGDKKGVLTAIAIEGFEMLADTTRRTMGRTGDLIEGGLSYIRFALDHPAHYEVMFRPDLYRTGDPGVVAARTAGAAVLFGAVRDLLGPGATERDVFGGVMAAWSWAHGFASLWAGGNVAPAAGERPEAVARRAADAFVRLVEAQGIRPKSR